MKFRSVAQKGIVALLVVFLITSIMSFGFLTDGNVAFALTWGGQDTADLWQYQEDFLDVANAKQIVDTWDKSKLHKPIVIAIIDTGIRKNHELFDGVLLTDENGEVRGYNADRDEHGADVIDDTAKNHGTEVAGVVAMLIKEFGLQDHIKIYTIKANTGSGDTFNAINLAKALNDAVAVHADVINMSLGYPGYKLNGLEEGLKAKFQFAVENAKKSAVIVSAAGNDSANGADGDKAFYPAAWDSALGVMNLGENGSLYSTSNFGEMYDLCAPGHNIYTSNGYGNTSTYGTGSGTSMASPSVAFATALLKLRYRTKGIDLGADQLLLMMRNIDGKTVNDKYTALSLATILTQDFENTSIEYHLPTGISLLHNGTMGSGDYAHSIYMRANDASGVSFIAKLLPQGKVDPDIEKSVEWKVTRYFEDGTVAEEQIVGKGLDFEFMPTRGGDFEITAQLRASNLKATQTVHVEYLPYYVGEVKVTFVDNAKDGVNNAPSSGVIYAKNTTRFALTGMEYLNPDIETKWFVNGEYVASGVVFEFTPKSAGTYKITAQYGDNARVDFQYAFTAEVKPSILRPLDLSLLIVGLVLAVGISITITIIVVKKKQSTKSAD